MRKSLKFLLASAAFALVAGIGIATTPAKADIVLNPVFPFIYITPPGYTYAPYNYAPQPYCYWDVFYGRVCY